LVFIAIFISFYNVFCYFDPLFSILIFSSIDCLLFIDYVHFDVPTGCILFLVYSYFHGPFCYKWKGCVENRWLRGCGFLFWVISGYFWHGHVLSSESIKTMFPNSDLLDTLADVRPNCAMLESLIIRS